ncbi:transposase [Listeria fleischmannii 1991]|uniref:Transposase and inactivated derivatives n=2 Tax=Listeria fleischmannii TaxID=1069827 RepID=A0A2X3HGV5_9LIST|nr:helix-turn-helix domain-containing protein [Listeria fleischmannii]EMG26665.1 transposase [Listeria fleischmannii subsp. fleischmannii LU2006-1]KMT60372.1 transposase [Listeria fleischmannii 1991]SQC70424.1 Transposase and inactivated derivatives [Listeria fleischmannii subsp. fleischmannii]
MTINKTSFEKRLCIVKEVLETKKSRNLVAKENNLSCATVRDWIDRYQTFGKNGLHPYKTKAKYSSETKQNAVEDVLYQGASQRTVMRKYKISSSAVLRAWISNYNKQKDLKKYWKRAF